MKMTKHLLYILIGSIFAIIILVAWDLGTPDIIIDYTINPLNVDWALRNININSIIQTLLSALMGFALTIFFIEILLNKAKEDEINKKIKLQNNNITKVLKYPVWRYHKAAICITNNPKEESDEVVIPVDFQKMGSIFDFQLFVDETLLKTKLELYKEAYDELKSAITLVVLNSDFTNNERLSDLFSKFLYESSKLDYCDFLLSMKQMKAKDTGKSMELTICDAIKNGGVDISKIKPGDSYYAFMCLKKQIEYNEEFLRNLYEINKDLIPVNY